MTTRTRRADDEEGDWAEIEVTLTWVMAVTRREDAAGHLREELYDDPAQLLEAVNWAIQGDTVEIATRPA